MAETQPQIHDIYDRIFKKILTLSSTAIINLINGLFKTNYPLDSTVSYNWTEFHNDNMKKILADTIITINGCYSYHLEAQMTNDNEIIFRVFEYSFYHAMRGIQAASNELIFPEPMIIYLYYEGIVPDEYDLVLNFGPQGTFHYKAKVLKFLDVTLDELNSNKMVILIPFQLLKLRKILKKERSQVTLDMLKSLITNDIIGSVNKNLELGNITKEDARRLKRLSLRLYNHLYSHYEEMKELNEMTDESLMLDIDIIEKEHEEQIAQIVAEKDKQLAERDEQIKRLQEELERLKNN